MENNKVQLSLQEQLEQLKKEQEEAKRICDKRIDMGMLYHDPESVQALAAEILDRKLRIQELENQIAKENCSDEKALVEYKPKMNIFQWIKSKFDKIKESMQTSRKARMSNAKIEIDSPKDRYQKIVNQKAKEHKIWDLTPEAQEVVEQGYEDIRAANNQVEQEDLGQDELSQGDLDKVHPYQEGIAPRYDFPKKIINQHDKDKFLGR